MASDYEIALVAAIASLLVATASSFTTYLVSRSSKKSARDLQILKDSLDRDKRAQELKYKELEKNISALKEGIAAIQHLKDDIRLIIGSQSNSMPAKEIVDRLITSRDNLVQAYGHASALLLECEINYYHEAKQLAIYLVEIIVDTTTNDNVDCSVDKSLLMNVHTQLGDLQSSLRELRMEKIFNTTRIDNQ